MEHFEYWGKGQSDLTDYHTKHHIPMHHQNVYSLTSIDDLNFFSIWYSKEDTNKKEIYKSTKHININQFVPQGLQK